MAFIAILAVGGALFLWQKHSDLDDRSVETPSRSEQSTPAPRQTYEHDWAKKSLDTTHSVIDQIQRQRKEDDLKDAVGRR